jgi:hypothetical protein
MWKMEIPQVSTEGKDRGRTKPQEIMRICLCKRRGEKDRKEKREGGERGGTVAWIRLDIYACNFRVLDGQGAESGRRNGSCAG